MSLSVPELAMTYSQAWQNKDPAAIAALHTEDSVFHLHNVHEPWVGRDAIAAAAAEIFEGSPDLGFELVRAHVGADHYVGEYVMKGTTREGKPFACEGTDVFAVRDGQIARKDSYIDWVTYQKQTGIDVVAGAAAQIESAS